MRTRVVAVLAFIVGLDAYSEGATPPVNDLNVIAAMKTAWQQSSNGSVGIEAAFRLDGNPSEYEVVAAPSTHELMKQTVSIIPGTTFALFHVHPTNGDPAPSRHDRDLADKYNLKMLTMHRSGLFEYDPVERKTIKLRDGLDWISRQK
jgi:hypothetical protein